MKVMVIGNNVATVQLVSNYCLKQGTEVFPYYGIPTEEEMSLFAPEVLVLCLPMPQDFLHQINQPYILWSEQSIDQPRVVSTTNQLQASLQQAVLA